MEPRRLGTQGLTVSAAGVVLTREDLQRIDEAAPKGAASGERYADMSVVDR